VGWAAGIERLAMLVGDAGRVSGDWLQFVLVPSGAASEAYCEGLIAKLRRKGISCDMAYRGNMKKRMQRANASGAEAAIIVGEDELAGNFVTVKCLQSGEQARRDVGDWAGPDAGATYTASALLNGLGGRTFSTV
jgi:histidyl-tRNA synthetase